jgi:Methyltransferase domain
VSEFDDLADGAERVLIEAWDFGWLDGRAVEDRPTWRYFDRVVERVAGVSTLLEVQAGVGPVIGSLPSPARLSVATEGFAPSVAVAAPRLRSRGVRLVVTSQTVRGMPFAKESFELMISRHPVEVWWQEIDRVLQPGGTYFAQHVGPPQAAIAERVPDGPSAPRVATRPPGSSAGRPRPRVRRAEDAA